MFNLGMGEIVMILLLALIFIGPKKLPELASGLGRMIREVRKATSDIKNEIELDDAIRKPLEELRDAATLPPEELKRQDRERKERETARQRAEAEAQAAQAAPSADDAQAAQMDAASQTASLLPGQGEVTRVDLPRDLGAAVPLVNANANANPNPNPNPMKTQLAWKPYESAPPAAEAAVLPTGSEGAASDATPPPIPGLTPGSAPPPLPGMARREPPPPPPVPSGAQKKP